MTSSSHSNYELHSAALEGSAERVGRAITLGADVNALDCKGRTVIACIIQGIPCSALNAYNASYSYSGRVEALRLLLNHPGISLYTLNASDPQGATPLGAAAGMNLLEIVQSLLSDSSGAVSVDGIDSCGATALMHACYAGNTEVVRSLLKHGARPDFRDSVGCTAIQRARQHPDILWMCELALRRHRWRKHSAPTRPSVIWDEVLRELELSLPSSHDPTPPGLSVLPADCLQELSQKLCGYTSGRDLDVLHSYLFPFASFTQEAASSPVLVNHPDPRGWSPIHYCASAEEPSLDVLMALYLAGADVSLPTTEEQFTPLHCLVSVSRSLTAESLPSLLGFVVHLARDLGSSLVAQDRSEETPLHIAAEHGTCLEVLAFLLELDVSGAAKDVRNSRGLTPREVAKPEFKVAFGMDVEQLRSLSSLSMMTVRPLASRPIEGTSSRDDGELSNRASMYQAAADGYGSPSPEEVLEQLSFAASLLDSNSFHQGNTASPLGILKETQDNLENLLEHHRTNASISRQALDQLTSTCASVERLLNTVGCSVDAEMSRRGLRSLNFANRGSEDSQLTAVSSPHSLRSRTTSAPSPSPFQGPTSRHSEPYLRARSNTVGSKVSLAKSTKSTVAKKQAQKLTLKFTNWFKRKVVPVKFLQPQEEIVIDDDESFVCDDFDPTRTLQEDFYIDEPLELAMRLSFVILNAARRDLASIRLYIQELSGSLAKSEESIAKVERIAKQFLHRCSARLHEDQLQRMDEELSSYYDIFTCPPRDLSPPCRPPLSPASSMCSISSAASQRSFAGPAESAELKSIRRLLVRRVAGRLDKIQSHIQNEAHWLFIVEEAVKDVKRRTYVL